jgi:5'-nucleotidase
MFKARAQGGDLNYVVRAQEFVPQTISSLKETRKVVLVDMDGVLADFETQFLSKWREAYPKESWVALDERKTHYVDMDPSGVYDSTRSHEIIEAPGFYKTMAPIPGAIEALLALDKLPGIEACICTAPFGADDVQRKQCEAEKREWVSAHLGDQWLTANKFICTKNKVAVSGVLLIDDKPDPYKAGDNPPWQHVVFSQPFNTKSIECEGKPRMQSWAEWQQILLPLLDLPDREVKAYKPKAESENIFSKVYK